MVDREMLAAISDLLDQKLEEKLEQKLEEKLDRKLEEKLEEKLEQKFEEKLSPICARLDRLEQKTDDLSDELRYVKVVQLENNIIPRLNTIEACFTDAADRWIKRSDQIDAMQADIDNLKITVEKHSSLLQKKARRRRNGGEKEFLLFPGE